MVQAIQEAIVSEAQSVAGLNCSANLDAFTDLLAPVCVGVSRAALRATLALPYGKGGVSTCALVTSAIHYQAGFAQEALSARFVWGESVSRIVAYLRAAGMWINATPDKVPEPGNAVVIGHNADSSWGGVEHVFTVTGWNGDILESVDGGLVDAAGLQAIGPVRRRFVIRNGAPWVVHPEGDLASATGRRVQGWGGPYETPDALGPIEELLKPYSGTGWPYYALAGGAAAAGWVGARIMLGARKGG